MQSQASSSSSSTALTAQQQQQQQQQETFSSDPRIHFNRQSNKWAFEADDGTEMEWDEGRGAWVPVVDDEVVAKQQQAYSVEGVDETAPTPSLLARDKKKNKKKRKAGGAVDRDGDDEDEQSNGNGKPAKQPRPAKGNTAVFISSLPPTTTTEQLRSTFSKAGLILEDGDGVPKVKLYHDDQGRFKGEALVVYFQRESVELAVRLFDETELELGSGKGVMKVKEAKWEDGAQSAPGGTSTGAGTAPQKKPPKSEEEKQKMAKKAEKLKQKLTDWSSSDDEATLALKRAQPPKRNPRVVVLSHMFTLAELEEDPTLLLDLKEDVRDECEKTCGEVTNVTLYDKEPDGIMTVRFKDEIAAQACIVKMHKRFFAGRSVTAVLLDPSQKYRKSGQGSDVLAGTGFEDIDEEEEREEKERAEKYEAWLEAGGNQSQTQADGKGKGKA